MDGCIIEKANKCISCKSKPCQSGCPLNNDTGGFINLVREERYKEAYELLCKTTVLQSICGKICPHERQCEGKCVKNKIDSSVNIGDMESYIGDMAIKEDWNIPMISEELKDKKVAIVGSGPAGITCAAFLAREGCVVTLFEKDNKLGGLLEHGIPEFRLDKKLLEATINKIINLGIDVKLNKKLGVDFTLEDLIEEYDAIFLAFGSNVSIKMNIEGEELIGVYGGNELLEYNLHPNYIDKKVAVIGGGNVAMDVARSIKKLGAQEVTVIYRRIEDKMPAEKKEIIEARTEGINFLFETNIKRIIGNKNVEKIECVKTKEENNEIYNINESNYFLDVDYVVISVGSKADDRLLKNIKLDLNEKGKIKIDDEGKTSRRKVFAGGDLVGEKSTIAWASKSGRDIAENIKRYLKSKEEGFERNKDWRKNI